jgi:hypothetical protein
MKKLALPLSSLLVNLQVLASILVIPGTVEPVYAAEFLCPSGDVTCLIASINQANQNGQENTISLEVGTYTLRTVDNNTNGANGLPSITSRLTITQDQMGAVIERDAAAPLFRIFHVASGGRLSLFGLLVRGGFIDGLSPADNLGGGGILNLGVLEIRRVIVAENRAFRREGPIPRGGGILSIGRADIIDSRVADNSAVADGSDGGGIYAQGELNIVRSNINDNGAGGSGGGVFANGTVNVDGSAIYGNGASGLISFQVAGGLQVSGSVNITNSTIARNFAVTPFGGTQVAAGILQGLGS